jgi:hypothetical protein
MEANGDTYGMDDYSNFSDDHLIQMAIVYSVVALIMMIGTDLACNY